MWIGFGKQDPITLVLYTVVGIALGVGVNRLNKLLDRKLPKVYASAWAALPLKLLPVILVVVAMQLASRRFASDWQSTTPGLFFVTFFFGLQSSLMEDAARLA